MLFKSCGCIRSIFVTTLNFKVTSAGWRSFFQTVNHFAFVIALGAGLEELARATCYEVSL